MPDARPRIFAQGDLDGACFLYSIVNAHAALCGRPPEFERVCAAFGQVDHPADFLNASVGTTGGFDQNHALLQANMERMLALLQGGRCRVQRLPGPMTAAALGALLDAASVVILRYQGNSEYADNMDHWVCAVAYEGPSGRLAVACSVRRQRACEGSPCRYAETWHPESGRWSNDALCPERAYALVEGEAFVVRVEG